MIQVHKFPCRTAKALRTAAEPHVNLQHVPGVISSSVSAGDLSSTAGSGLSAFVPLNTRNHREAGNIIFSYETKTELCGHRCPALITCQAVLLVDMCDPDPE